MCTPATRHTPTPHQAVFAALLLVGDLAPPPPPSQAGGPRYVAQQQHPQQQQSQSSRPHHTQQSGGSQRPAERAAWRATQAALAQASGVLTYPGVLSLILNLKVPHVCEEHAVSFAVPWVNNGVNNVTVKLINQGQR